MPDHVKVMFRSNLDDFYLFQWPELSATVPAVGDRIQAKPYTQRGEHRVMELTVVGRTFYFNGSVSCELNLSGTRQTLDWWESMKPWK